MTISLKIRTSNQFIYYSKDSKIGVVIYLIPENSSQVKNVHFIIAVDNSPSMMKDGKFQTAVESAQRLISSLPKDNMVTLILFSNHPRVIYTGNTGIYVPVPTEKGATTRFHELIRYVIELSSRYQMPTKAILLTDGKPVDKRNVKDYEKLSFPANLQIIAIGIGRDYNEVILKRLADMTAGLFYHIEDPSQLPQLFQEQSSNGVFATNVRVNVPQGFSPLNFDMPIRIPIVEGLVAVYGVMDVPPGDKDFEVPIIVTYNDPSNSQEMTLSQTVVLKRAPDQVVEANVNKEVEAEIQYYTLLRDYTNALETGKEATKVLQKLREAAEATRREDLIEATQRLTGDSKVDLSEATKKMRK